MILFLIRHNSSLNVAMALRRGVRLPAGIIESPLLYTYMYILEGGAGLLARERIIPSIAVDVGFSFDDLCTFLRFAGMNGNIHMIGKSGHQGHVVIGGAEDGEALQEVGWIYI